MAIRPRLAAHARPDRRHRGLGDVGIVAGEMHQDQAATLAGLVEVLVDLDAVVAHRGIDRQAGAGQVGKLAAETEAHNADLAGAVRAGAQGRDDVAQVACELGGVELCPQRPCLSAALVGVRKVAGRLLPPEDIRRQGDEPVGGVAVGHRADVRVGIEHLRQHNQRRRRQPRGQCQVCRELSAVGCRQPDLFAHDFSLFRFRAPR